MQNVITSTQNVIKYSTQNVRTFLTHYEIMQNVYTNDVNGIVGGFVALCIIEVSATEGGS